MEYGEAIIGTLTKLGACSILRNARIGRIAHISRSSESRAPATG